MISPVYTWQITSSHRLTVFLSTVYFLGLIACFINALPWEIQLVFACLVLQHAWLTLKRLKNENWQLNYDEKSGWQIIENGATQPIEILASTVVNRTMIFLHYECENKKRYRLIAKDALLPNFNDYRQLIVTLKTYR